MKQQENVHDIVVVGAGIAGLSAAYRIQERLGAVVTVLESSDRVGGTATTDHVGGFTIDRGPNGFLSDKGDTWRLAHELGIGHELRASSDLAKNRFIYADGALKQLSANPLQWLQTDLLSVRGRLRAAMEPLIPAGADRLDDESVWSFFARRFGREFASRIATPAVIGITAGDARRLSMKALFPQIVELEREHSSLVRGMLANQLARTRGMLRTQISDERQIPEPPGGTVSFGAAGMQRLCDALADSPGVDVKLGTAVIAVTPGAEVDGGFVLETKRGRQIRARQVVLATPAYVAATLTRGTMGALSSKLGAIPYCGAMVVTLGYENRSLKEVPRGFGYLVSRGEGIRMLGCQWTGSIFPDQVPAQHSAFRCLYGGTFDAAILQLGRGQIFRIAQSELRRIQGVEATPILRHHVQWQQAIPQHELGHIGLVREIESESAAFPGLHFAGNAYNGVALNACVSDADRVATEVLMQRRGSRISVPERLVRSA